MTPSLVVVLSICVLCTGCLSLPDTWNLTEAVDHRSGDLSTYVGVSGPITYPWKRSQTP
jgi:hypothetical protein